MQSGIYCGDREEIAHVSTRRSHGVARYWHPRAPFAAATAEGGVSRFISLRVPQRRLSLAQQARASLASS